MPTNTKMHFLVVNDSDIMQRIIVALLKEIGYIKVSEADDGQMALRSIATAKKIGSPIEFIITDCSMPIMNGLELIRTLRRDGDDIPILMITAEAKIENILTAVEAGADSYLVKPFKAEVLQKKIEALLVARRIKQPVPIY